MRGALAAIVDSEGHARGYGAIHIRAGSSIWVLVADGTAHASCADLDDDGVGGLVQLTLNLRDPRTGQTFVGVISPADGEVDASGRVRAQLSFVRGEPGAKLIDGVLRVRFAGHQW